MKALATSILAFSALLAAEPAPAGDSATVRPTVKLEKARFTLHETVFFWLNVDVLRALPADLKDNGQVFITRPDGTLKIDTIGLPMDGPENPSSFSGGWGLGSEQSQPGKYSVAYEFLGVRSPTVTFTVEDVPELDRITGTFVLPDPLDAAGSGVVALELRNGSNQVIHFPPRSDMQNGIGVNLRQPSGTAMYPVDGDVVLRAAGLNRSRLSTNAYSWDALDKLPGVALEPGGTFRLELKLREVLSMPPDGKAVTLGPGEYELRLSTTFQILVGDRNGPYADFSPMHLAVESKTRGHVPDTR